MNMIKKTDGFTLVELIVVIAILAILAAIAVPAYSGYITKANEAADITQLDAIMTAVVFTATEDKLEKADVISIIVTANSVKYVNKGTGAGGTDETVDLTADADFLRYIGQTGSFKIDFKSNTFKTNGAKWVPATATENAKWIENK